MNHKYNVLIGFVLLLSACGGSTESGQDAAATVPSSGSATRSDVIVVVADDGNASLTIAQGSLPDGIDPETISLTSVADTTALGEYVLKPDGLVLDPPGELSVSVASDVAGPLVGFLTSDGDTEPVDILELNVDEGGASIVYSMPHFSRFQYDVVDGNGMTRADLQGPSQVAVDSRFFVTTTLTGAVAGQQIKANGGGFGFTMPGGEWTARGELVVNDPLQPTGVIPGHPDSTTFHGMTSNGSSQELTCTRVTAGARIEYWTLIDFSVQLDSGKTDTVFTTLRTEINIECIAEITPTHVTAAAVKPPGEVFTGTMPAGGGRLTEEPIPGSIDIGVVLTSPDGGLWLVLTGIDIYDICAIELDSIASGGVPVINQTLASARAEPGTNCPEHPFTKTGVSLTVFDAVKFPEIGDLAVINTGLEIDQDWGLLSIWLYTFARESGLVDVTNVKIREREIDDLPLTFDANQLALEITILAISL